MRKSLSPAARHNYLSVRIKTCNVPETLAHIRKTWQSLVPSYPLDYMFLVASFEQLHNAEQRMSEMFSIFSVRALKPRAGRTAAGAGLDLSCAPTYIL